jgi:hypothetical protein
LQVYFHSFNNYFLQRLYTYIKIGYLLHLFTLLEICFLYATFEFLDTEEWLQQGHFVLKILLLSPFISMPFFPQFDAWSRYQNYKMLRDQFYFYGFQPRIVKSFIKSRCQRDAALAAADELGFTDICKKHFYNSGYRWYHIFPDFVFTRPKFLLCKHFWLTTFFAKNYHPRISDKMIQTYKLQQTQVIELAA